MLENSRTQDSISNLLQQIRQNKPEEVQRYIFDDRLILKAELQKLGLSMKLSERETFFIDRWLVAIHHEDTGNEDALPDYQPGGHPDSLVQNLEQKTNDLSLPSDEASATSSKADPPPYTFEGDSDPIADDNFSRQIQEAVANERFSRLAHRQRLRGLGPHSWGCKLSKHVILQKTNCS